MKIIILGAGQVGGTLAEASIGENDRYYDHRPQYRWLAKLQDKYDLRVVNGHASHPIHYARLALKMPTC